MRLLEVISLYISHKQSLGHRFRTEEGILRSFCKAVGNRSIETIGSEAVLAFLNSSGQVTESWVKKHRILSGLYRFSLSRGLAMISPLPCTIPKPTVPAFVPYIYSHENLKRLLDAVPAACAGRVPIEEEVLRTLLLLLYGTGIRIGEALALTVGKVDLLQACLVISKTKFFKSRLVPVGKDLIQVLDKYISWRVELQAARVEAPLFCFLSGSPLSQSAARSAFRRLRSQAGIERAGGSRRQPRLHDLRHTFAVHRLLAWYRAGADLQEMLPKLATYLGHVDLSATQRYLTMTPELLQEASLRFEHYAMGE